MSQDSTCVKAKRFEFVEEGFALSNHGITSLQVVSPIECAMECTAILECKSFNFKVTENVGNNCELNDATRNSSSSSDYKETAGLVYYEASPEGCLFSPCKNLARCTESCSGDSSFKCDCIHDGTYGDRCELWTDDAYDFSLHFPSNDTSNFVVFDCKIQTLDEFTICLWLQTTASNTLSLFSYGTAFYLQCRDTGKCVLGIGGNESTFYIAPLNDGYWHQLCLSRKATNESLKIFLNGFQGVSGKGARNDAKMFLGGGQLIIGQKKMLSGQSFDGSSSFKGDISHFNIWSRWRNISEVLVSSVHNCSTGEFGDQVDWRLLKAKSGLRGDVQVNTPDTCSTNSGYYNGPPSVRFFTENAHKSFNVTVSVPQALLKFTICTWVQPALWENHGVIWSFAKNQTFDLFRLHLINGIARFDIRGQIIRKINFPLIDGRSHFICTLWDNVTGRLEVMVDGKLTSSGEIAKESGIDIPSGSTLILGTDFGKKSLRGHIGGLNVWDALLEKHCIVALYHGNGRESGRVIKWRDVIIPEQLKGKKVLNSEEEHKGQKSEFTLYFKTRSSQNFANQTVDFKETNKLSACAWLKTKEKGAIFQFLATHNSTRHNFLVLITADGNLEFKVGSGAIQNVTNLNMTDDQWHHVCLAWRRSDGQTSIYFNGKLVPRCKTNKGHSIEGSGDFVIGQYMNESTRRFIAGHEFVGKITQVNVWVRYFDPDVFEIMSRDCRSGGEEVRWIVFRDSYHGNVQLIESSECLVPDFTVLSRRDERCNEKYNIQSLSCNGTMKALFDRNSSTSGKMWRCYHECALVKSSLDGSFIFNQACGGEECITNAHNDLLAIT
ncbi:hypothetical protein ACROYT_G034459 [Oculina patagonica]